MPQTFALIAGAFQFFKRQPALAHVLIWMLALPILLLRVLGRIVVLPGKTSSLSMIPFILRADAATLILLAPAVVLLLLVIVWGSACILMSARRTIQTKAGRARTSFRTLRKEAAPYVPPLVRTCIVRAFFVLFRLPLLIVPGILYAIRTIFAVVAVVCEDLAGSEALRRSVEITRGRTGRVFVAVFALALVLFLPASGTALVLEKFIVTAYPNLFIIADVFSAFVVSFAATLFLLALVELFAVVRRMAISVKL